MNTENFEKNVLNTVGYNEAENKKSFLAGAHVGYRKAKDEYEKEIKSLRLIASQREEMHDQVLKDIKTLVSIISKYSDTY